MAETAALEAKIHQLQIQYTTWNSKYSGIFRPQNTIGFREYSVIFRVFGLVSIQSSIHSLNIIEHAHWLGIHVVFIVWISQSNPHFVAARISMVFRHWISQSILYGTVRIPIVQTLINMFFTINFPNFSQTCYLSHRLVQTIHYCPVIFWVNWVNELNKQTNAYRTTLHWFTLDWKPFKRLIVILEVYSSIP